MRSLFTFWRMVFVAPLALYLGGSSSSETKNTTNNMDKRLVVSDQATGVSADNSTVTITSTDHGAVAGAFDAWKMAASAISSNYDHLLATSGQAINGLFTSASDSQKNVAALLDTANSKGTIDNRTIAILGIGAAAVLALFLLKGKK